MVDRTHAWTQDALEKLYGERVPEDMKSKAAFFAPILPLENAQQSLYLEDLESEHRWDISGLALYHSASLEFVPETLSNLPRLLFSEPDTPHSILRDVSLGADLLTTPFVGECSDAGIVLEFTFPAPAPKEDSSELRPFGLDMWASEHAADTSPMSKGCQCYACKNYHRAYVHHLLMAKEMTAWALIQMHNIHVMDLFFAGIRDSIQRGTYEDDVYAFNRVYASSMPETTGRGPRYAQITFFHLNAEFSIVKPESLQIAKYDVRLRGYQTQVNGPTQSLRMPKAYGQLDQAKLKFTESQIATPDTDASGLEEHGFAKKV